jgi:thiamine-phosphate pyrophosphorylase
VPAMLARGRCHTVHSMAPLSDRRARLAQARLYFVCDGRPGGRALRDVLPGALAGGVDVFQLRDKHAGDRELLRIAAQARALCHDAGALFVLNDRPDLAVAAGADGVHVGQDDEPVAAARAVLGPDRLVGLSTHGVAQADAAAALDVDYIAVGPVHATPTKLGRPAIGLEPVRHAARTVAVPWFAIGGVDGDTVGAVAAAGASRVVVVRAIAEAADPEQAARDLRAALERPVRGAVVGGAA